MNTNLKRQLMRTSFTDSVLDQIINSYRWVNKVPDDPRVARRLVIAGSILCLAFIIPINFRADWNLPFALLLEFLCLIAGIPCLLLGGFVFFRRAVWARQQRVGSGLVDLGLGVRNNPAPANVSMDEPAGPASGRRPD